MNKNKDKLYYSILGSLLFTHWLAWSIIYSYCKYPIPEYFIINTKIPDMSNYTLEGIIFTFPLILASFLILYNLTD